MYATFLSNAFNKEIIRELIYKKTHFLFYSIAWKVSIYWAVK